jgi:hypothetical protein
MLFQSFVNAFYIIALPAAMKCTAKVWQFGSLSEIQATFEQTWYEKYR